MLNFSTYVFIVLLCLSVTDVQSLRKDKCMYEKHIRVIKHSSFTPLCSEGMGPLATIVYKHLASLISEKSMSVKSIA